MAESEESGGVWGRPPTDNVYRGAALRQENIANTEPKMQQKRRGSNTRQQAAFARQQTDLTQSRNIGSDKIPTLGDSGPLHELLKIEHKGPIEALWEKIKAFVRTLENTDIQTISDDGKIAAYHYALPRYVLFRIQIFQNPTPGLPFVVEFQRREGDAWVHTILFQTLRALLADNEANSELANSDLEAADSSSSSVYTPLTPSEANENFQSLDLRQSEGDLDHWVRLLNQPNLLSTQSASGCIAMATRTETNLPYLMKAAQGILKGFQNCLKHSKDPPTLFGCGVVLSTLAAHEEWCQAIVNSGIVPLLITTIVKWSGSKVRIKQTVYNLLLTLRCIIDHVGRDEFLRAAGDEAIHRLFALSKNGELETDVSVLLTSILEMLQ